PKGQHHPNPSMTTDEKELIEGFATIFTVLDMKTFRDVFTCHINTLIHYIILWPRLSLLILPQHFLNNTAQTVMVSSSPSHPAQNPQSTTQVAGVSKIFADCLLHTLV